jgi:hypothetical protein
MVSKVFLSIETELGDEGGSRLFQSLEKNETLQTLSVKGNKMTDKVGNSIGKLLEGNKVLMSLDLGRSKKEHHANSFGILTVKRLCKGLEDNQTLEKLYLVLYFSIPLTHVGNDDNEDDLEEIWKHICIILCRNDSLSPNKISEKVMKFRTGIRKCQWDIRFRFT